MVQHIPMQHQGWKHIGPALPRVRTGSAGQSLGNAALEEVTVTSQPRLPSLLALGGCWHWGLAGKGWGFIKTRLVFHKIGD